MIPDTIEPKVTLQAVGTANPDAVPVVGETLQDVVCDPNGILYTLARALSQATGSSTPISARVPVTAAVGDATIAADALDVAAFPMLWSDADGVYYAAKAISDANAPQAPGTIKGMLAAVSRTFTFYNGNWNPLLSIDNTIDARPTGYQAILTVAEATLFNGNTMDRVRSGSIPATALITAVGPIALFTPIAGQMYRLMRYTMELTEQATLAVAGNYTVSLQDAAGTIICSHTWFVPAVAVAGIGNEPARPLDLMNGFLSAAANNVLNVVASAALATGGVRINAWLAEGANG